MKRTFYQPLGRVQIKAVVDPGFPRGWGENLLLPTAYEVWWKVLFSQTCVIHSDHRGCLVRWAGCLIRGGGGLPTGMHYCLKLHDNEINWTNRESHAFLVAPSSASANARLTGLHIFLFLWFLISTDKIWTSKMYIWWRLFFHLNGPLNGHRSCYTTSTITFLKNVLKINCGTIPYRALKFWNIWTKLMT